VGVVVIGVFAENQPQVLFASDQYPVEALAPGAGDPAFGYGVRPGRLNRGFDDPHADRMKHCVEPTRRFFEMAGLLRLDRTELPVRDGFRTWGWVRLLVSAPRSESPRKLLI
jgi:hypothetical protein